MRVLRTSSNLFDRAALQLLDADGTAYRDTVWQSTSINIIYTRASIVSRDIKQIIV